MSCPIGCHFEFGHFLLDPAEGRFLRDGLPLSLEPKVFLTLVVLVENSGHLLTKDELMRQVWPDTVVEEGSLTRNVSTLRRILGDAYNGTPVIETLPKRGYRFVLPVKVVGNGSSNSSDVSAQSLDKEKASSSIEQEAALDLSQHGQRSISKTQDSSRHLRVILAVLGILTIVATTLSFAWYKLASPHHVNAEATGPIPTMKIKRFTSDGRATLATISPDGKYLVHVTDNGVQQSLSMRQVTTYSDEKQILPPADVRYSGLTFSPDGDYIYYVATENGGDASLYQMPALGGASKKLIVDIDTPISFSPDGRQFVFDRGYPDQGEDALMIANADGTGERKLATRKGDYWLPAWSPDGKLIASRATTRGADTYRTVVAVQVNDGTVRPIGSKRWWGIGDMVWMRDGSGLVISAREQESDPFQIWYLSYPGGETHRITNDLNDYESIGLTPDSRSLVAVQTEVFANIWSLPHGEISRATQITFTKVDGFKGISWAPGDQLVYESGASGNPELWSVNANGSNPKQLTTDSHHNATPVVSPDGKYVVFWSNRAGQNNIWRMDIDGGNLKQLTFGPGEQSADISPDSKWIVFTSRLANATLWKISIDGGSPVQLTDKPSGQPSISPDGKLIACNYMESGRWKVAVIPFDGGKPIKTFASFTHPNWLPFHWTPDGHSLAYIDQRIPSSIWSVPVFTDGPPKLLLDFKAGRIFDFAWTHGGSQLAVSRGEMTNDVVLISDFH